VCGTYVYLDGKHSHDYVACNAIPCSSARPTTTRASIARASERTPALPARFCALLRARMPPVFNDLIKNVSPARGRRQTSTETCAARPLPADFLPAPRAATLNMYACQRAEKEIRGSREASSLLFCSIPLLSNGSEREAGKISDSTCH
jgi:hypothetical protein